MRTFRWMRRASVSTAVRCARLSLIRPRQMSTSHHLSSLVVGSYAVFYMVSTSVLNLGGGGVDTGEIECVHQGSASESGPRRLGSTGRARGGQVIHWVEYYTRRPFMDATEKTQSLCRT